MCRIENEGVLKLSTRSLVKSFYGAPFFVPQAIIQLMPLENAQISDLRTRNLIFLRFIVRFRRYRASSAAIQNTHI